jgi:plasmid stabilization system protein ParE
MAAERVEQRPEIRRLPLANYPYVIYYTMDSQTVTVLCIMHGARRQPWPDEEQA